jgi:type IV pilus assembly protein PilB
MVTLTLLDGTEVRLPANRKDEGGSEERGAAGQDLTASDLVQALFARSEGADVSDVLPDARWERLFATLLTLLLRKGLIADWEFVDEWRKHQGS